MESAKTTKPSTTTIFNEVVVGQKLTGGSQYSTHFNENFNVRLTFLTHILDVHIQRL